MKRRQFGAALTILFTPLSAGCTFPRGEEVSVSLDVTVREADSGFEASGVVSTGGGIPEQETFENVAVVLYDGDGEKITSEAVGRLDASGGEASFSISAAEQPHYISVESEDFWQEQITVDYFVLVDDGYRLERATERSDLPVY